MNWIFRRQYVHLHWLPCLHVFALYMLSSRYGRSSFIYFSKQEQVWQPWLKVHTASPGTKAQRLQLSYRCLLKCISLPCLYMCTMDMTQVYIYKSKQAKPMDGLNTRFALILWLYFALISMHLIQLSLKLFIKNANECRAVISGYMSSWLNSVRSRAYSNRQVKHEPPCY